MIRSAYAELDLAAVTHNLARIRAFAPKAKVMAVIKANAYGHGLVRIAKVLSNVDAFAVARLGEGIALRDAGIGQRIAVLQGFVDQEELELHIRHRLEPVVHSPSQVELLERIPLTESVTVWIKLDTGMHRLGLLADEFASCYSRLQGCPAVLQPVPVMTHLANADVLQDTITGKQLDQFKSVLHNVQTECSIANSAGLIAWDAARVEWVRPGIALYGVSPFSDRTGLDEGFKPVMTFRSRLIAIKNLNAGDAVGYGGDWICPRPTRLGIASVGYGDGYPRHAQSGTPVLIRDQRVCLVGRVSMDMISLDLTDCPNARVGDEITLWGKGLPVEEIAHRSSTIPYALLCGVTPRVKMVERWE
ncbi:alanine racemase [Methylocaldum sp.]|uniref:alanine racemase n=1 Tax=Methylocaldum sp. TaxID=1969727 RepID=UPI002D417BB6|nr:alanine racemase [Methylocaldum sp.]HYE35582.1 alanine racemase [Methylocaldum sp.]